MRIDRDANEFVSGYEILNFLRDNREYSITLRECEKLVKFFDSDEDGRLSYRE
jgi:Ca2+-binding EF-hand superfamily protein